MERWKIILEAPDYAISDKGSVKRIKPDWQGKYEGRILRPSTPKGYHSYVLSSPGGSITRKAHRLVCMAFNGPCPPDKTDCAHKDGNKDNNTPQNLYWATSLENAADRDRHGTTARGDRSGPRIHIATLPRGEAHWSKISPEKVVRGDRHYTRANPSLVRRGTQKHLAKLSDEQIAIIREKPFLHGSGRRLSEEFGVSMGLISAVRKRRVWTHLP